MEKDNEAKGAGNHHTTEFRQYDSRLGRWFSIDPEQFIFPWQSPFCAYNNNPIYYTDPHGNAPEEDQLNSSETTKPISEDEKGDNFIQKIKGWAKKAFCSPELEADINGSNEEVSNTTVGDNGVLNTVEENESSGDEPKPGRPKLKLKYKIKRLFKMKYWFKKKAYEEHLLSCIHTESVYKTQKRRLNFSLNFGFRTGNIVWWDVKINSKRAKFEGRGTKPDYFPGRKRKGDSYSTARIQLFYRVKDGTNTHANRYHPFFFGGKRWFIPCCTEHICDGSSDHMD